MLISLIVILLNILCHVITLSRITDMESASVNLYSTSIAAQTQSSYPILLTNTYTTIPTIVHSLDLFGTESSYKKLYFNSEITSTTITGFIINTTFLPPTIMKILSIRYLAVEQQTAIWTLSRTYLNSANISSLPIGPRSYTSLEYYSFDPTTYKSIECLALINGFSLESNQGIGIYLEASVSITNSITIFIKISTDYDCEVKRVKIALLFLNMDILEAKKIYANIQLTYVDSTYINNKNLNFVLDSNIVYLFGLFGFIQSTNTNTISTFGITYNAVTSDSVKVIFTFDKLTSLNYKIISFFNGTVVDPPTTPNNTSTTPSTNSPTALPIIVGAIVGVLAIVITIFILFRCISKKQVFNKISKDELRGLPSFNF